MINYKELESSLRWSNGNVIMPITPGPTPTRGEGTEDAPETDDQDKNRLKPVDLPAEASVTGEGTEDGV